MTTETNDSDHVILEEYCRWSGELRRWCQIWRFLITEIETKRAFFLSRGYFIPSPVLKQFYRTVLIDSPGGYETTCYHIPYPTKFHSALEECLMHRWAQHDRSTPLHRVFYSHMDPDYDLAKEVAQFDRKEWSLDEVKNEKRDIREIRDIAILRKFSDGYLDFMKRAIDHVSQILGDDKAKPLQHEHDRFRQRVII